MWKDVTGYRQGEDNKKPRALELQLGKTRLVIVWNHLYCPNEWCYHLHPILQEQSLELYKYSDIEQAKKSALEKVVKVFENSLKKSEEAVLHLTTRNGNHSC